MLQIAQNPRFLRRNDAARHVRETWGLPCQPNWLAKLAVIGGGPPFRKAGRVPLYEAADLDAWARSRLSERMASTSDVKALPSDFTCDDDVHRSNSTKKTLVASAPGRTGEPT